MSGGRPELISIDDDEHMAQVSSRSIPTAGSSSSSQQSRPDAERKRKKHPKAEGKHSGSNGSSSPGTPVGSSSNSSLLATPQNAATPSKSHSKKKRSQTALIFDERMFDHLSEESDHPECPERIQHIVEHIHESRLYRRCKVLTSRSATDDELSLAHDLSYVHALDDASRLWEAAHTLELSEGEGDDDEDLEPSLSDEDSDDHFQQPQQKAIVGIDSYGDDEEVIIPVPKQNSSSSSSSSSSSAAAAVSSSSSSSKTILDMYGDDDDDDSDDDGDYNDKEPADDEDEDDEDVSSDAHQPRQQGPGQYQLEGDDIFARRQRKKLIRAQIRQGEAILQWKAAVNTVKQPTDQDVIIDQHTATAARLAAGCPLAILDHIFIKGDITNGMAVVRPPGHHAKHSKSEGFCFFNNVAIAAFYARRVLNVQRVLVVDWDVHHGNGTEDLVAASDDENILFFSVHRFDSSGFYPGTGRVGAKGCVKNILNVPLCGRQVFTRPTPPTPSSSSSDPFAVQQQQQQQQQQEPSGESLLPPFYEHCYGDSEYLKVFEQVLVPAAREFKPDLVLISAGFDAACGDPLGHFCISPEGYAKMTAMMKQVANKGRVVVVTEGGYQPEMNALCSVKVLQELLGTPSFASRETDHIIESVQTAHRSHYNCFDAVVRAKEEESASEPLLLAPPMASPTQSNKKPKLVAAKVEVCASSSSSSASSDLFSSSQQQQQTVSMTVVAAPHSPPVSELQQRALEIASRVRVNRIRLSVGGQRFETTRSCLVNAGGLLATLFDGVSVPAWHDVDGVYFLDRDPQTFSLLLSYLRDKDNDTVPAIANEQTRVALIKEAAYFGIKDLPLQ